jgi:hypothetical protein
MVCLPLPLKGFGVNNKKAGKKSMIIVYNIFTRTMAFEYVDDKQFTPSGTLNEKKYTQRLRTTVNLLPNEIINNFVTTQLSDF